MFPARCKANTSNKLDNKTLLDEVDMDLDMDSELEVKVEIDVDALPTQKPHFLDLNAVPPPDFEESFDRTLCFGIGTKPLPNNSSNVATNISGEQLKLDKKYERDGEISDYELAASGYTKKEFTQDDNTLHLSAATLRQKSAAPTKIKHFLDENPIPPDYMLQPEREHRSLDRNFERQNDALADSRKSSLDRASSAGSRSSRNSIRSKEPPYTLSRFLDSTAQLAESGCMSLPPLQHYVPKGGAWTESYDSRYSSLQLPTPPELKPDIDSLGPKVECVYSLLSMLGSKDSLEMSKKFLELSRTPESCAALRRAGCIPLLVQMMHSADAEPNVRKCAGMALQNVVLCHPDEKAGRREAKVLRLLDQIMNYCNFLKTHLQSGGEAKADDSDQHPLAAISSLMKVSFDEEHRHAMCELGALQAIPNLMQLDHAVHGPEPNDECCNSLRRFSLMALTNLTFGDENNKALLCSQKLFMQALVSQLANAPDDLLQVTASVLRNLSWRADNNMKTVLNEIGTVKALALAAMKNRNENTLKAILSALWNLSAHCSTNKAEFCAVDGALAFLVEMLTYDGPSKTLKIIENAGGILRNVSSHIAVRENYRQILRKHNCLWILLQQLKSESLTVVSNSCGTLWNLSARSPEDQKFLWDNGAVPMLRSLIHSKHAMIAEGSSSALKNLLNFRPSVQNQQQLDPIARSIGLKKLPTLNARKQKALEQELQQSEHAETSENLDLAIADNTRRYPLAMNIAAGVAVSSTTGTSRLTRSAMLTKSESRDSVFSAKSDSAYENLMRSHSACADNRKVPKLPYATRAANFNLETDVEPNEEQPIDYAAKYSENSKSLEETSNVVAYQETDLDQPTDFSLRYAENQLESTADKTNAASAGNEILLILEDSVKCYQTEDTPYVISNAASVTDLRQHKLETTESAKTAQIPSAKKYAKMPHNPKAAAATAAGSYTPEKPINYCEEGTPGYFSRYESLSSLDESPPQAANAAAAAGEKTPSTNAKQSKTAPAETKHKLAASTESAADNIKCENNTKLSSNLNSAQETPLMFSRRSSMDSLVEEDVGPLDDKSSVISEFSRLASGVISPSEIPDSPTQSMPQSAPQSPRRISQIEDTSSSNINAVMPQNANSRPLRSVFEDDLNTFHVEHTPAQFSTATSLSNLSILDDENNSSNVQLQQQQHVSIGSDKACSSDATTSTIENVSQQPNAHSEGEEEETAAHNDDLLLANCINMGMHRSNATATAAPHKNGNKSNTDETKQYYTENTPALLSKMGSNSNLSALSICSSSNEPKAQDNNRLSLNLSDDVSSNASESGHASQSLLQQCILDGMKKKPKTLGNKDLAKNDENSAAPDAISMLRCGGNALPAYLPVKDEMSKYLVEDSPCNFSVMSGLSNLTVGSSLVGPAVQLQSNASLKPPNVAEDACRQQEQLEHDSLSSLSIDSEDDTNLLSQAIAAGCNRPKSNLGFSSCTSTTSKRSMTALSASQPIPINSATSACSLNSAATSRQFQQQNASKNINGNESFSSVESSDSNDNQSKSLFELCILTGMQKARRHGSNNSSRQQQQQRANATQSNPNLKNFAMLPQQRHKQAPPAAAHSRQQRERERKDEKLLQECISTGISKRASASGSNNTSGSNSLSLSTQARLREYNFAVNAVPKNVQATSVAAPEACHPVVAITSPIVDSTAATDVEKNSDNNNSSSNNNGNENVSSSCSCSNSIISTADITDAANAAQKVLANASLPNHANDLEKIGSKDLSRTASLDNTHSDDSNESFIMETTVSLEQNEQRTKPITADKHKNPDLMLKSVERLTLEFVTSAEQLRTIAAGSSSEASEPNQRKGSHSIVDTNSSSTWNETTCANDVSFPSISITVPLVNSYTDNDDDDDNDVQQAKTDFKELHDFAEITPTNEQPHAAMCELMMHAESTQPNSLETQSQTFVDNQSEQPSGIGINFQLGGKVISAAAALPGVSSFFSSNSNMINSTMIAFEARALAEHLQPHSSSDTDGSHTDLTFSVNSLDLEQIRPPSGMESLSMSGFYQEAHSLQRHFVPTSTQNCSNSPVWARKTPLPAGIVARRALGANLTGSADSVNSSCNLLDNIKPPSLMDELLDSMISVASIQSEVAEVDCESMATTVSVSNYETATAAGAAAPANEFDDNTITLQSCFDANLLPDDVHDDSSNSGTPLPTDNNYSSAESTPKKSAAGSPQPVKRTLTPKQKRDMLKDRYKTYTITSELQQKLQVAIQAEDVLQIEILEMPTGSSNVSANRRRNSQERYQTQTIVYNMKTQPTDDKADSQASEDISSIRAMTKHLTHLNSPLKQQSSTPMATESDFNSIEGEQNSETESCHAASNGSGSSSSVVSDAEPDSYETRATTVHAKLMPRISKGDELETKSVVQQLEDAKAIRGGKKASYVSPYSIKYQRSAAATATATTAATSNKTFLRKGAATATTGLRKPAVTVLATKKNTNTTTPSTAVLQRQGTFVQEEPTAVTAEKLPIVSSISAPSSPSKLPTKQRLNNANNKPTTNAIPVRAFAAVGTRAKTTGSMVNNNRYLGSTKPKPVMPTRKLTTVSTTATTNGNGATIPQRSISNANIKTTSHAARQAVLAARVSSTTPPSRSNSNLNSNNAGNALKKIQQTQSRIASIWKRVDEVKDQQLTQQQQQLATNKTSGCSRTATASRTPSNTTKNQATSTQQLTRSSTFDSTPTVALQTAAKQLPKPMALKTNKGATALSTKIAMTRKK